MIREQVGHTVTGKRELLQKHSEARQLVQDLAQASQEKVINAIPHRDIPEDVKDAIRTSVRAVRAYMHHLKIPVRLSEKNILQRCRFVTDDRAVFRNDAGHTHEIRPLPAALYEAMTELFIIHTPHMQLVDRFGLIRLLVHEIMHSISHNETRITAHPSGDIRMIRASGYRNARSQFTGGRGEVLDERFIGLNEAVTDLMALRAIDRARALPEGYIKLDYANDGYTDEKNLFHIICDTIGNRIGKTTEEMERIFFQGYIDGTRMHLRMIEEHFGRKALRILSRLGQHRDAFYHGQTLNSKVIAWFTQQSNMERDELYHEILAYPTPQQIAREAHEKAAQDLARNTPQSE